MGITDIQSEATLRQRMDNHAKEFLPVVEKASRDFLKNIQPELKPLNTGHIPLDADVTPMDNSGSAIQRTSTHGMCVKVRRFSSRSAVANATRAS